MNVKKTFRLKQSDALLLRQAIRDARLTQQVSRDVIEALAACSNGEAGVTVELFYAESEEGEGE